MFASGLIEMLEFEIPGSYGHFRAMYVINADDISEMEA
jgi:hypothetical protein